MIEITVKSMIIAAVEDPNGQMLISQEHQDVLRESCVRHWTRMRYEDAVTKLQDAGFDVKFGDDLKANHELYLASQEGPMFITHYPLEIKFFNMKQNEQDSRLVNSADLILPIAGESAGAAEREHEHDKIKQRLKSSVMYKRLMELGGTDEDFAWYLNAHKGREIPLHSGTGIGLTRVMQYVLGVGDIHETMVYPTDFDTVF
jgi:asparaginyl-tRNA synthetase